jgi:uncharacterized protein YlzI (FlbEa/FlbD family)
MAKNADRMEEALSLLKSGKSFRECEKLTGVSYKRVERESKKRGIEKGALSQLIQEKTRVETEYVTLCDTDKRIVSQEVDERVRQIQFFNEAAIRNVREAMATPCDSQNDFKARSETINKGRECVLGKTPDTAIQINNGQQETHRVEFEVLSGNVSSETD